MKRKSKNKGTGFILLGNTFYEQTKAAKAARTTLQSGERPLRNSAKSSVDKPYVVLVDDNFHYMDESERYKHGVYLT